MSQDSCPACGGTDLSYDGSCGGQLAKCLDCGWVGRPAPAKKDGC